MTTELGLHTRHINVIITSKVLYKNIQKYKELYWVIIKADNVWILASAPQPNAASTHFRKASSVHHQDQEPQSGHGSTNWTFDSERMMPN